MKNLIKKAIGKAKDSTKFTVEAVRDLIVEDPKYAFLAFWFGFSVVLLAVQSHDYVNGWNDGAEETRKSLITALVNNRIGHGESEADAFKMANGLIETVKRR